MLNRPLSFEDIPLILTVGELLCSKAKDLCHEAETAPGISCGAGCR